MEPASRATAEEPTIVVPHGGHGFNGLEGTDCIDGLQAEFVPKEQRWF